MFFLILPECNTLSDPPPLPRSAKIFRETRLAVYRKPEGKYGASVKVTWRIAQCFGDVKTERDAINSRINETELVPDNPGAEIDSTPATMAFIGVVLAVLTIRNVIRSIGQLAALP